MVAVRLMIRKWEGRATLAFFAHLQPELEADDLIAEVLNPVVRVARRGAAVGGEALAQDADLRLQIRDPALPLLCCQGEG
jgi:hypothetical protein